MKRHDAEAASLKLAETGVPGVAVACDAAVGHARGVKELGVDALVALAGALVAREAAFGRAPVEAAVVLQLVERPIVEP